MIVICVRSHPEFTSSKYVLLLFTLLKLLYCYHGSPFALSSITLYLFLFRKWPSFLFVAKSSPQLCLSLLDYGTIKKVLSPLNQSTGSCLLEEIELFPPRKRQHIRSLLILHSRSELYVGVRDQVIKIPLKRCSYHKSREWVHVQRNQQTNTVNLSWNGQKKQMCLQRSFKAPSFTRCSLSEGARPLCWSGAFGEIKNPLNQLCLSHWRCPRLPCLAVAHCHWPAHKTTCFLPRAQSCSDRVRVFIRYIEFLSVWKKLHQGINIGKENQRQRPGCEDSLRLGSHPSSHTGKESHLHTLSLAQWAVIGIHKRLKASYYSCGSVIYAAAIMALHHIADAFFPFVVFFLKREFRTEKNR